MNHVKTIILNIKPKKSLYNIELIVLKYIENIIGVFVDGHLYFLQDLR
jgi:hypothetical protein